MPKISILMLTHNARKYTKQSIVTLKLTKGVDYELIVLDNNSGFFTRNLLKKLKAQGYIDKLIFNPKNDLFAKGNNLASEHAAKDSDYYLLLNSDVEIKSKNWLSRLLESHPAGGGISAFGAVLSEPIRADGYCLLINKYLFDKYKLNEDYEWWWGVTQLEADVLKEGKDIIAIVNHEEYIHHFGGKSGKGYKDAKGLHVEIEDVVNWFDNKKVKIIDKL